MSTHHRVMKVWKKWLGFCLGEPNHREGRSMYDKFDDSSAKEEVEAKSIRQIHIRYSDLKCEATKTHLRDIGFLKSNLGQVRICAQNEGHIVKLLRGL